jgi:hemerythrin-like domain-containing protein
LERGVLQHRQVLGLVALLERQFATHMAGEDKVLFPELESVLPEAETALRPLRAEHEELRAMLRRLQKTLKARPGKTRDERISVETRDLVDLLRIHVRKEEAIVLSVAEQVLTPREVEALDARIRFFLEPGTRPRGPEGARQGDRL